MGNTRGKTRLNCILVIEGRLRSSVENKLKSKIPKVFGHFGSRSKLNHGTGKPFRGFQKLISKLVIFRTYSHAPAKGYLKIFHHAMHLGCEILTAPVFVKPGIYMTDIVASVEAIHEV